MKRVIKPVLAMLLAVAMTFGTAQSVRACTHCGDVWHTVGTDLCHERTIQSLVAFGIDFFLERVFFDLIDDESGAPVDLIGINEASNKLQLQLLEWLLHQEGDTALIAFMGNSLEIDEGLLMVIPTLSSMNTLSDDGSMRVFRMCDLHGHCFFGNPASIFIQPVLFVPLGEQIPTGMSFVGSYGGCTFAGLLSTTFVGELFQGGWHIGYYVILSGTVRHEWCDTEWRALHTYGTSN